VSCGSCLRPSTSGAAVSCASSSRSSGRPRRDSTRNAPWTLSSGAARCRAERGAVPGEAPGAASGGGMIGIRLPPSTVRRKNLRQPATATRKPRRGMALGPGKYRSDERKIKGLATTSHPAGRSFVPAWPGEAEGRVQASPATLDRAQMANGARFRGLTAVPRLLEAPPRSTVGRRGTSRRRWSPGALLSRPSGPGVSRIPEDRHDSSLPSAPAGSAPMVADAQRFARRLGLTLPTRSLGTDPRPAPTSALPAEHPEVACLVRSTAPLPPVEPHRPRESTPSTHVRVGTRSPEPTPHPPTRRGERDAPLAVDEAARLAVHSVRRSPARGPPSDL